jgi:hypothetical protein
MSTNLPPKVVEDSAQSTKLFFDSYGEEPLSFPVNDIKVTVAFFQSRGFDQDAAEITAMTILKQAKLDNLPVYQLLDSLKDLDGTAISALISEILNNNRPPTSILGYQIVANTDDLRKRNIGA